MPPVSCLDRVIDDQCRSSADLKYIFTLLDNLKLLGVHVSAYYMSGWGEDAVRFNQIIRCGTSTIDLLM